jgi:hypothetical protein
MPARIKADLAFGIGKNLDAFGIKAVEAGVCQHIPMRRLKIVQPLDLAFAFEVACGIRKRLETLEEIAQTGLQMFLKRRAVAPDHIALIGIETGKAQAVAKAACLRSSSLI